MDAERCGARKATAMIISGGGVSLGGMASVSVWLLPRVGSCLVGRGDASEGAQLRGQALSGCHGTATGIFSRQKSHKSISGQPSSYHN